MLFANLLNFIVTLLIILILIGIGLALLGAKWKPFRQLKDGYFVLLKVTIIGAASSLWRPAFRRDGIGNLVEAPRERERT